VDYRFKYDRKRPSPERRAEEERIERDRLKRMRGLAIGWSIPFTLAGGPVAGWLLGMALDYGLGTAYWIPVLVIIGTIAGLVASVQLLIQLGRL
jgi:F0F1-type ATP synthase assembly protein I